MSRKNKIRILDLVREDIQRLKNEEGDPYSSTGNWSISTLDLPNLDTARATQAAIAAQQQRQQQPQQLGPHGTLISSPSQTPTSGLTPQQMSAVTAPLTPAQFQQHFGQAVPGLMATSDPNQMRALSALSPSVPASPPVSPQANTTVSAPDPYQLALMRGEHPEPTMADAVPGAATTVDPRRQAMQGQLPRNNVGSAAQTAVGHAPQPPVPAATVVQPPDPRILSIMRGQK